MPHPQQPTRPRQAGTPARNPPRPREVSTCTADRHGTYSAYQKYQCRCPSAREDWRLYHKRHRHGRAQPQVVDATGTRRRLQALAAMGWPQTKLAAELGYATERAGGAAVYRLMREDTTRVNVRTAQAVEQLYDRLAMSPGPSQPARQHARQAGWAPPLAWDDNLDDPQAQPAPATAEADSDEVDPIAVDRACDGTLGDAQLTPAEQAEAVRRLSAAGASAARIAERLHISARHVQRIRADLADAADPDRLYRTGAAPDIRQALEKVQRAQEAVARRQAADPGTNQQPEPPVDRAARVDAGRKPGLVRAA